MHPIIDCEGESSFEKVRCSNSPSVLPTMLTENLSQLPVKWAHWVPLPLPHRFGIAQLAPCVPPNSVHAVLLGWFLQAIHLDLQEKQMRFLVLSHHYPPHLAANQHVGARRLPIWSKLTMQSAGVHLWEDRDPDCQLSMHFCQLALCQGLSSFFFLIWHLLLCQNKINSLVSLKPSCFNL